MSELNEVKVTETMCFEWKCPICESKNLSKPSIKVSCNNCKVIFKAEF